MKLVRDYQDALMQHANGETTDNTVDRLSRMCRQLRLLTIETLSIGYSLEELILLDRELLNK